MTPDDTQPMSREELAETIELMQACSASLPKGAWGLEHEPDGSSIMVLRGDDGLPMGYMNPDDYQGLIAGLANR